MIWTAIIVMDSGCLHPPRGSHESPGLRVDSKQGLLLEGKLFRGVGVNYYDVFQRQLGPHPRSLSELDVAFRVLRERNIPFVRFAACGYWPSDWSMYQKNRAEYFRRFSEVVWAAERQHVGLIPSLFWHQPTISDLVGEPFGEWGNAQSKTRAMMRQYTREVVQRFSGFRSIWAWEFGNEFNLPADLPNAAEHRPPTVPELGTAKQRGPADDLSHRAFREALAEFAREVRMLDAHRLIVSGNAFPRPSAWHQMHEKNWGQDSTEQWIAMLEGDNPGPMDSWTGRLYTPDDFKALHQASLESRRRGVPLFLGELGVPGVLDQEKLRTFDSMLEALDTERIGLAALWVYDFDSQEADWNVRVEGNRSVLLQKVSDLNRRWNPGGVAW